MDEITRNKLRKRLLQYPGATEESVVVDLFAYEYREEEKRALIEDRHFSNALAEAYLDRKGYPRPPGWHTVFFYPGSNRPRNTVVFCVVFIGFISWWLLT